MDHHYSSLGSNVGFGDAVELCGREGAEVATAAARERIKSFWHPEGAPFLVPNVGWCGIRWAVGGMTKIGLGTQADREDSTAQEDPRKCCLGSACDRNYHAYA